MSPCPPDPTRGRLVARSARARAILASGAAAGARPSPRRSSGPGLRLDILGCDYRVPLARLSDEGSEGYREAGCGCAAVCTAGRSSKGDGLVGSECWSCPLAGARVD